MNFFMQRIVPNIMPALGTLLHTYILTRAFVKTGDWSNPPLSSNDIFNVTVKRYAEGGFRSLDLLAACINYKLGAGERSTITFKSIGLASTTLSAVYSSSYEQSDKEFGNRISAYRGYLRDGQALVFNSTTIFADIEYAAGLQNNIPHKAWPEAAAFLLNGLISVWVGGFTFDAIKAAAFPAIVAYITYNQFLHTKLDNDLPIARDTLYEMLLNSTNTTELTANYNCDKEPFPDSLERLAHAVAYNECVRIHNTPIVTDANPEVGATDDVTTVTDETIVVSATDDVAAVVGEVPTNSTEEL